MKTGFLIVSMLSLLAAACVPNRQYRTAGTDKSLLPATIHEKNDQLNVDYTLSFVEFDDMGELFEPAELDAAIKAIQDAKSNGPATVVVFIHGWENNASDRSGSVWGFRSELASVAAQSRKMANQPVVGIYFGWRGLLTNLSIAKPFTFWNRRDAATRIPGAHMSDALHRIFKTTKPSKDDKSSCIVIGHSFGGLVLERALTPALAADLEDDGINDPDFPDLVVFINEAGPATEAKQLLNILKRIEQNKGQTYKQPLFLSLTSAGDFDTRLIFPAGQAISPAKIRRYPKPDEFAISTQKSYWLHTTANIEALQSHEITLWDGKTHSDELYASVYQDDACFEIHRKFTASKEPVPNNTRYWVMQIPTQFVPDHGQVFRPSFINLLDAFLYPVQGAPQPCAAPAVKPPSAPRAIVKREK